MPRTFATSAFTKKCSPTSLTDRMGYHEKAQDQTKSKVKAKAYDFDSKFSSDPHSSCVMSSSAALLISYSGSFCLRVSQTFTNMVWTTMAILIRRCAVVW